MASAPPSRVRVWTLAARPKTLFAAIVPVAIGTALAWTDGGFHAGAAAVALLGALLIQIGTNFVNDYVDFLKGADTEERVGPMRVTQAGLVSARTMQRATVLVFGLAFLSGLYLVYRGGWPILLVGLVSIAAGILYTATRYALAYTGVADLAVFLFFGPVAVAGTYYVQTLTVTPHAVLAGVAPGLLSMALLVVNNLRDEHQDRAAGKKTLVVRFGRRFGLLLLLASLVGAVLVPPALWAVTGHGWGALAACFVLVPGWRVWRAAERNTGRALMPVLGQTAQLLVIYGALFLPGWLLT